MDGNRRWANKRHLPLFAGHERGARVIEPLVDHAIKIGISYLTFWAFSTENWKRSEEEVQTLMDVFRKALHDPMMKRLDSSGARIKVIGDMTPFPSDIIERVDKLIEKTKENTKLTVNFALNYGGRQEILQAVNRLLKENKGEVTEEMFAEKLYTAGQPDPDLIIRTGGEQRLSGYLPWQGVYSELAFVDTYWPDFSPEVFDTVLSDFASRQRRFGK